MTDIPHGIPDPVPAAEMQMQIDPSESEVTLSDIARACGMQISSARTAAWRERWPSRRVSFRGPRGSRGALNWRNVYRVADLPARVQRALGEIELELESKPESGPELEVTLSDIAVALGIQINSASAKARREGWPRRMVTVTGSGRGGRTRYAAYRVAALPAGVRQALAVPALSPAARESYAGLPALAQAMGLSPSGARKRLERLGAPYASGRARSRGREYLYPLSALPPGVRAAVERIRAGEAAEAGLESPYSDPVSCACCGERIADPESALACGRCDEAVCARRGCMHGDKCRRCRRASRNWRYYHRAALARAAAALDASRAARGECPVAELAGHETGLRVRIGSNPEGRG